jgi:tungstate transport system substrate-binding protein
MGIGSVLGAMVGGYLVPLVPAEALKFGLGVILIVSAVGIFQHRPSLCIATTSSAHDSGILGELLREFKRETWCRPTVLSVGSGKALELLETGRAHIALTHSPRREHAAQARGSVREPLPIMANPYVLVGPPDMRRLFVDALDASDAMRRVAASGLPFVSRGDDSGTHERELELWRSAGVPDETRAFITYARAGMARSLHLASVMRAFTLCDRATFVKLRAQLALDVLYEGHRTLDNVYSVVLAAGPSEEIAAELAGFLRSADARRVLARYRSVASEGPLFTPAA